MKYKLQSGDLTPGQIKTMAEIITTAAEKLEVKACLSDEEVLKAFRSRKCLSLMLREMEYDISFAYFLLDAIIKIIEVNSQEEEFEYCHNWHKLQGAVYDRFEFEINIFGKINEE